MALFSIVVPVLNEAAIVQQQLRALQPLRAAGHELLVVDGGSEDGSADAAALLADRVLASARGRARQMNTGAAAASHENLLFLHLDSQLPGTIADDLAAFIASERAWGFFPVRLADTAVAFRVIEFFMNRRSRFTAIATGDQTLVIRREVFRRLNGFADICLMEDVDICKRLKAVTKPWLAAHSVVCDTRKWRKHGIVHTTLLMWYLRLAFFLGGDPDTLHKLYYGKK